MIDICDFAVGLSRQLHGLTIASERPNHRMMEQWLPLGPTAVITAFNFPVAVWAWNAALGLVCGNSLIWKPSEKTPLTAIATQALFEKASASLAIEGTPTEGLLALVIGEADLGKRLAEDSRVALVSATGSCRMGADLAPRVAARFGKCLLELGGNNAVIVSPTANLDLAIRGTVFGAWGTAGQHGRVFLLVIQLRLASWLGRLLMSTLSRRCRPRSPKRGPKAEKSLAESGHFMSGSLTPGMPARPLSSCHRRPRSSKKKPLRRFFMSSRMTL
jgi:delta 1-pyrroline-5-carboxylate dehydrogenase